MSWRRLGVCLLLGALPAIAHAQGLEDVDVQALLGDGQATATTVRMVVLLTLLSFLPGVLLVMTPFTRFVIVFSLLRQALGLQQAPPNQVLVGLSLILSAMVMQPTLQAVQTDALDPYIAGEITTTEAMERGLEPMRGFMLANIRQDEFVTALRVAGIDAETAAGMTETDVATPVIVTAFVLSELEAAFTIAIHVYIPFLVVDVIVASVLLGMGMMMLPPVVISMPFKLLVFVLMDGWELLVLGLVQGIR